MRHSGPGLVRSVQPVRDAGEVEGHGPPEGVKAPSGSQVEGGFSSVTLTCTPQEAVNVWDG